MEKWGRVQWVRLCIKCSHNELYWLLSKDNDNCHFQLKFALKKKTVQRIQNFGKLKIDCAIQIYCCEETFSEGE